MRSFVPVLWILSPALLVAGGEPPATGPAKSKTAGFGSISELLPNGSELQGVTLPRYDKQRRLSALLKAKAMTLVDDQTIAGETIRIEFFNRDQTLGGSMDLKKATFHSARKLIEAREPVTLHSEKLHAEGTGLIYSLEEGKGFLLGPLTTWTRAETLKTKTTMNTKSSPLLGMGLAGMALISQSVAAPPPPVADAEKAALQADVAGKADDLAAAGKEARKELAAALDASNAANAAAKEFLEKANLISETPAKAPEPPEAKPLDIKPGPKDTLISCDGGMYFDPDEGVFVYLKNVRVTDPRFTMTGANELKIFLQKVPEEELKKKQQEKAKAAGKEPPPDQAGKPDTPDFKDKFGDPERIVATGTIVVDQKPADGKDPIKASGAVFTYDFAKKQVLISGGYPWVMQGSLAFRAKEPNLILRIDPEESRFDTEGAWDTILPLEQLQKENEKRKQEKKAQGQPNR